LSEQRIRKLASFKSVEEFEQHLWSSSISLPCDSKIVTGRESPLLQPVFCDTLRIGNRFAIQPMEGWDGLPDGAPSENTLRRWRRFGQSGAKLIWGGEAVAVSHDGRANPNQLLAAPHTESGLAQLRSALIEEHRKLTGSDEGLLIGLQLTHSGRFSSPNAIGKREPRILYRHPFLDRRMKLSADHPVLSDSEIQQIIENFHRAALMASRLGFDFVDIKHCHGYLGHEFLSAHTRNGAYGGSFENRTRFLREITQGIRAVAPQLRIAVRLSAIDSVPFLSDPIESRDGKAGVGVPEEYRQFLPYRWGFGVNPQNPLEADLSEPAQFLSLLQELGIALVNITVGSPYYNPHMQRPALFPPSDGYLPPEDPLAGVARQLHVTKCLKQQFPNLIFVGTGYSYLQEFLPHVAQAAVREGWTDLVGLGRMALTYPELLWDAAHGRLLQRKRICRTFSDCTTAPRNGLPSGCYPLDEHYKNSAQMAALQSFKKQ
jgi:2,4-dienoyl-CoA reductase-like NADH-dependent reductase (Old Yellow Enzyme family)